MESLQSFINKELDRTYLVTAGPILEQAVKMTTAPNSQLQVALRELEQEAVRLEEEGKQFNRNNEELQKVLAAYAVVMVTIQALIDSNGEAIELSGGAVAIPSVTAKVFQGIAAQLVRMKIDPIKSMNTITQMVERSGLGWTIPAVDEIAGAFVNSGAWAAKMSQWAEGYVDLARQTLVHGIQKGWGPRYTASYLRQTLVGLPYHAAANITRTLQLTSYREGSLAMENVNGRYIEKKIRIAVLDDRTCLSCVALHGTELEPGERVDDHYNGRCSEYYVVVGGSLPTVMQADSPVGGRKIVKFQTGPEWFASLPEARQKRQASFLTSPAKYKAYKDGTQLQDFVTTHQDSVFGNMYMENSLKGVLGSEAQQYYGNKPKGE